MAKRPASVAEEFVRHAESTPEKLCVRFESERWSYGRVHDRVRTFAAALRSWGLQPGERVALFLGNSPDFLAAYLGTHLARGVVVPVNVQYRRTELRHIFDDAGVRLCLTDAELRPELDRARKDLPELEAVIEVGEELESFLDTAEAHEPELPGGEDLAVIAYTSGTTGSS
jgi:malonyl-CoA/methylmalonyl-CoA synthetase